MKSLSSFALATFGLPGILLSQETAPPESGGSTLLDTVYVIGSEDAVPDLPGSGAYLAAEDIRAQSYGNINRVLQRVPGVYLREEDGFGNFPNISLRGVDGGRSSKVTIMEDGIISAPAPYSSPSAYYFPNVGRMEGVEVLKGSSQVKYGPHTTGGVINFRSTSVPDDATFYLKSTYGTDNDILAHTYWGDVIETSAGNIGYLLELYHRQNDGFRTIDSAPGFSGSDDTGFTRTEPMLKVYFEPDSDIYQRFEAKFGYTDFEADETYLGLTESDFANDPYRRYAGSRFDNIQTEQYRAYLRHIIEPKDGLTFTTTAYYNQFSRNWFKINRVRDAEGNRSNLARAIAGGGEELAILQGRAAGVLDYRNNARDYYSYGIMEDIDFAFETGAISHNLEAGIRYHRDGIDRFQQDELFFQDDSGRITRSSTGPLGGGGNREQDTEAISIYLQDEVSIGNLTVTPGIRYEHLNLESRDLDTSGANPDRVTRFEESSLDLIAPGISARYEFSDELSAFGGVFRGLSTPSPRGNARNGLDEETSTGYELGVRYTTDAFKAELIGFHTQFEDLIVPDTVGASGGLATDNLGSVDTTGFEFALAYDPGIAADWDISVPLHLAFTYTNATLDGDITSASAESIFSGGQDGNRVPYIPEFQIAAGAGIQGEKFGLHVDASYTPATYTTANNTTRQVDSFGNRDSRFGETGEAFLVDLTASYQFTENLKILGGVKNILEESYVTSRLPEGPRSGAPRVFYVGFELEL